jgi:hypothetical protein
MAPTARFFDSWLSMVLNAVVLTWFAFFALGLSAYMGNQMFRRFRIGGGFLGGTFNVLGESHPLLRADDPHGHHLLPGPQPRLCAHWRRRCPARHPDDPERHDGLGPALGLGSARSGSREPQPAASCAPVPDCPTPQAAPPAPLPRPPVELSPEPWPPVPAPWLARDTARPPAATSSPHLRGRA